MAMPEAPTRNGEIQPDTEVGKLRIENCYDEAKRLIYKELYYVKDISEDKRVTVCKLARLDFFKEETAVDTSVRSYYQINVPEEKGQIRIERADASELDLELIAGKIWDSCKGRCGGDIGLSRRKMGEWLMHSIASIPLLPSERKRLSIICEKKVKK